MGKLSTPCNLAGRVFVVAKALNAIGMAPTLTDVLSNWKGQASPIVITSGSITVCNWQKQYN